MRRPTLVDRQAESDIVQEVIKVAVLFGALAVTVPAFMGNDDEAQNDIRAAKLDLKKRPDSRGGIATAKRDRSGHFNFKARVNGKYIRVLVDTGASAVAINRSTAKRIGIKLSKSDFRYNAKTANGTAKFAKAILKEVKIGTIRVQNVQAAVLDDMALDTTLLGMSFLNKLKRFEFKGNQLRLVQ